MPRKNISIPNLLNSPTVMSWMSLLTKSLTFILVIPLLVTRFSEADVALWYLFVSALSFQLIADLGFSSTLVRMFSFSYGGLSVSDIRTVNEKKKVGKVGINAQTVELVWQTMNYTYQRIAVLFFAFITISSYFLYEPIMRSSDIPKSMFAWGIIVCTSFFQLRYSTYSNYLQGMNKVALVKKWEALINLLAIACNSLVLLLGGDLLALVISNQFWSISVLFRDYFLARSIEGGLYKTLKVKAARHRELFSIIWPSAWKSGLGMLMSVGLLQITNMLFAKDGDTAEVASYLLAYSVMRQISNFAQAPFYSRIPLMAKLRGQQDIDGLKLTAQRGMQLTYFVFVSAVVIGGYLGKYALPLMKSNVKFPDLLLWALLGFGIFIERFGAMHIQIHSTTNKIIWHIANGVTGIIFLVLFFSFRGGVGIYIFPVALIGSNLLFYAWYCAYHSYKSLDVSPLGFERKVSLPFAITFVIYILVLIFTSN